MYFVHYFTEFSRFVSETYFLALEKLSEYCIHSLSQFTAQTITMQGNPNTQ